MTVRNRGIGVAKPCRQCRHEDRRHVLANRTRPHFIVRRACTCCIAGIDQAESKKCQHDRLPTRCCQRRVRRIDCPRIVTDRHQEQLPGKQRLERIGGEFMREIHPFFGRRAIRCYNAHECHHRCQIARARISRLALPAPGDGFLPCTARHAAVEEIVPRAGLAVAGIQLHGSLEGELRAGPIPLEGQQLDGLCAVRLGQIRREAHRVNRRLATFGARNLG